MWRLLNAQMTNVDCSTRVLIQSHQLFQEQEMARIFQDNSRKSPKYYSRQISLRGAAMAVGGSWRRQEFESIYYPAEIP